MKKTIDQKFAIFSIAALAAIIAFFAIISYRNLPSIDFSFLDQISSSIFGTSDEGALNKAGIKKFSSEQEFKAYLEKNNQNYGFAGRGGMALSESSSIAPTAPAPSDSAKAMGAGEEYVQRVSETNVQVLGIDEPDIVKTNGKEIYFSQKSLYRYWLGGPVFYEKGLMPPSYQEATKIIKALPIADLSVMEKIDKAGDLILSGNNLAIFSGEKIYGYDVSDSRSPKNKWTADLDGYIAASRLYNGKIYLVSANSASGDHPCPIKPMAVDGKSIEVQCGDIYYPGTGVSTDTVFTAMILNPADGQVEKKVSFIGSSGSSVVYMSDKNIFITYSYPGDLVKFVYNFIKDDCKDIIPNWLSEKLGKLIGYDISDMAKTTEL